MTEKGGSRGEGMKGGGVDGRRWCRYLKWIGSRFGCRDVCPKSNGLGWVG